MTITIVLGFRPAKPVMAICLLAAALLQLADVRPLRDQIVASIAAGPGEQQLDRAKIARLIAGARQVEVVPSIQCTADLEDRQLSNKLRRANMDLMLATARMNVPTNTVFSARQSTGLTILSLMRAPSRAAEMLMTRRDQYCKQEIENARSGGQPHDLIVLLSHRPRPDEIAPSVICSPLSWARYCVSKK